MLTYSIAVVCILPLAAYLWLFKRPFCFVARVGREAALRRLKVESLTSQSPRAQMIEVFAFALALMAAVTLSVIWKEFGNVSLQHFVDALKLFSLLVLAFVGVEIAREDKNKVARITNKIITFIAFLIAVGICTKLASLSIHGAGRRLSDIVNDYFIFVPVLPIAGYSCLDFWLMTRRETESPVSYDPLKEHQRVVARRFFVYCDLPAIIPLMLVAVITLIWFERDAIAERDLILSGAMAFVVLSHAICSKAVNVYNPVLSADTASVHVTRVSGTLDPKILSRIQVSMYNEYCSGPHLQAMIDWLYEAEVRNVEFQIADTLHAHNIRWQDSRSTDKSARAAARALGDRWINMNRDILTYAMAKFDTVRIVRWDTWRSSTNFRSHRKRVENLYRSDAHFAAAVNKEARSYFQRMRRSHSAVRETHAVNYLLEEIAVTEQCARSGMSNEIYPGSRFGPEEYLCRSKPHGFSLPALNYVSMHFDR